jgi:regulator of cell morphogenesis and NO signaling
VKITGNLSVATLAAELPGAIGVFESLGIDYACAGDRTLCDAAHAEGIDPETIISALRALRSAKQGASWGDRPLTELTKYLVDEHHRFVRQELASVATRLAELCGPDALPELISLRAAFSRMSDIVLPHLHREENHLFHTVEAMEIAWLANEPFEEEGDVTGTIRRLTLDHGALTAQLRTMRAFRLRLEDVSGLPPRARPVLETLAKLEGHLHELMFLENSALFPRVLAMEAHASA